jgi:hypothetical protein
MTSPGSASSAPLPPPLPALPGALPASPQAPPAVSLLLDQLDLLLFACRDAFPQVRTFLRAYRLALGLLLSPRVHLTSNAICATGRQGFDWSADYRLFSSCSWNPHALFDPIFDRLDPLLSSPDAPVVVPLDDTLCHKTGRRIPGVTIARDPLSPPFHVNLCYGLRFSQASVLVYPPDHAGPARALPVRFEPAPPARKPNKDASEPDWQQYKERKKAAALSQIGVNVLTSVRQSLDQRAGTLARRMIACGDGSYTNRTVLKQLPPRTTYIGRIRKDAKFFHPLPLDPARPHKGRPRRYGPPAPTPEQLLKDESVKWTTVPCFAAGQRREISVKVLGPVYWRKAGADRPLRMVVIRPLGYRLRNGSKPKFPLS